MYQDAFTKLELAEVTSILERLNPEFYGTVFTPDETTIMAQDISFYPGYRLLDIADYSNVPTMRRFVVYGDDQFVVLNFSNETIYGFNKALPVLLDESNVGDYARFFFTYVRGKHGRFIITEAIDDIDWKDDPPPSARTTIGKMISSLHLEKVDEHGDFHLKACMVFKDSLFKSSIKIEKNGFVSLADEELLIEDMPILDDTFGQYPL
jgi:hypothetical protein